MKAVVIILVILVFFNNTYCQNLRVKINEEIKTKSERQYQKRLKKLNDYLSLNPSDKNACRKRAETKYFLNDNLGAIKDCNRGLELDSSDTYLYVDRGKYKFQLKDYDGALADYNKSLEIDYSNRYYAYAYLAQLNYELNENVKALYYLDKPVVWKGAYSFVRKYRGLANYKLGNYKASVKNLRRTADIDKESLLVLGHNFQSMNKMRRACISYRRADLYYNDSEIDSVVCANCGNYPQIDFFGLTFETVFTRINFSTLPPDSDISNISPLFSSGFRVGQIYLYRFHKNIMLRTGYKYSFLEYKYEYVLNDVAYKENIEYSTLDFPIQLHLSSPQIKDNLYFLLGGTYCFDMSYTKDQQISFNRKNDLLVDFGIGFRIFIGKAFIAPEIKYSFGVNNKSINDVKLKSNGLDQVKRNSLSVTINVF